MSAPSSRQPRPNQASSDPLTDRSALALGRFAAELRNETDAFEAVDAEELARAVDGELDPAEQALWAERLALDPQLARRAADLASFRAELGEQDGAPTALNSRPLAFRRPPARVSLSGWLAAAAVLLLAVAVRETPRLVHDYGSVSAAVPQLLDWSDETLFADGFEAGDASGWSSASSSG